MVCQVCDDEPDTSVVELAADLLEGEAAAVVDVHDRGGLQHQATDGRAARAGASRGRMVAAGVVNLVLGLLIC